MRNQVKVSTSQMNAIVAPPTERLYRAKKLIRAASEQGSQLILLPELFNYGYGYSKKAFDAVEPVNGQTFIALKEFSKRYNILVGGSFVVYEDAEAYNRFYLLSPTGKVWSYDKSYPWAWERGYFKGSSGITVAETEIGRIGILICWDLGHTGLWHDYKDKVDMMLVCSCPPTATQPRYLLTDGTELTNNELGFIAKKASKESYLTFTEGPKKLAQALDVPVIASSGAGTIRTDMPNPTKLWSTICMSNPLLLLKSSAAKKIVGEFEIYNAAKIINAKGRVVREFESSSEDSLITGLIEITPPQPLSTSIPKRLVSRISYFFVDFDWSIASLPIYRKGIKGVRERLGEN